MSDDKLKVMVMGGHTTEYHQFSLMAPIYEKFLTEAGFEVKITEDRDDFLADRIKPFHVIVDYTTAEDLSAEQRAGLLGGIVRGKGFVGVHCAADSFKGTPGYIEMVGGKFLIHPNQQSYLFNVRNHHHPIMAGVTDFEMVEELYLLETVGHFDLLMTTWYDGIERPITWAKGYGLGRVAYTALGHGEPQTSNPSFQKIVINAINWTAKKC